MKNIFYGFFSHTIFWSCFPLLHLLPVPLRLSPTQLFASCSLSPPSSLLKNYPPKIRQTTNPGKQKCYNETKNPPQTLSPSCGLVLAGYSCARGPLLWSVVDPPRATTQETNGFPFASRYQLHTVSQLGVGPHVYFPVSVLVPHLDLFISYGWMFACMHLSALLAYLVATETRTGWISCS